MLKSRYLLVPFLFALAVFIVRVGWDFFKVALGMMEMEEAMHTTMMALTLLDITMIANLIWLIAAGSYYVFVASNGALSPHERPKCLQHVSTGLLKEKMAGSLIGVSSVHLLKLFLDISEGMHNGKHIDWSSLGGLLAIHVTFLVGLMIFSVSNNSPHHNHRDEEKEPHGQKTTDHP